MLRWIILIAIFFLNNCTKIVEVEKLIDKPVPQFKILNKVDFHQIQDYRSYDEVYWLVNKVEFDLASDRVKKKDHKIKVYEKWGIMYNNKFVRKAALKEGKTEKASHLAIF